MARILAAFNQLLVYNPWGLKTTSGAGGDGLAKRIIAYDKSFFFLKAKKLPATFDQDLDEGDVTEEDSADEMEEAFKFKDNEVRTPLQHPATCTL